MLRLRLRRISQHDTNWCKLKKWTNYWETWVLAKGEVTREIQKTLDPLILERLGFASTIPTIIAEDIFFWVLEIHGRTGSSRSGFRIMRFTLIMEQTHELHDKPKTIRDIAEFLDILSSVLHQTQIMEQPPLWRKEGGWCSWRGTRVYVVPG